jgi:hypothetical protein
MGGGGAFLLLFQLFMAISSTGSSEIIAVSCILTYDIYYEYINPELKDQRLTLRRIFYTVVQEVMGRRGTGGQVVDLMSYPEKEEAVRLAYAENQSKFSWDECQKVIMLLGGTNFFAKALTDKQMEELSANVHAYKTENGEVAVTDFYACMNALMCDQNIEGEIILRVSKFFTGIFAVFMGFAAVFLQVLGIPLGHVYMSMGCLVGSAVGPAALTILMERANGTWLARGCLWGFVLSMLGWTMQAQVEFGAIEYNTLMSDWPWVVSNVCAIGGGTAIAVLGSLMQPNTEFKWAMLNERINLIDDIEPPLDPVHETPEKLDVQVKVAVYASLALTFFMLVLWPLPMHIGGGVMSEGGFGFWIVIEILWCVVGGTVIILQPARELFHIFTGKEVVSIAKQSRMKEGPNMTIFQAPDVKVQSVDLKFD